MMRDLGGTAKGGIEVSGLCREFDLGSRKSLVISDCSFDLPAGMLTVMIGPSGCGKSALAKLIAGYDTPSSGTIRIDGRPVTGAGRDRLMVFQESALFDWMTTQDNALFGPSQKRGGADEASKALTASLLELVGLTRFTKRYPAALSGGMQRRLEMVRALANAPDLFILDEPFRGLDAMTRGLMQQHFADMFEETRRTTLFITTEIDEALLLADRILIMTNKPMSVAAEIIVDLPRPRKQYELLRNEHAAAIRNRALELLFPEAMKSFGYSEGSEDRTARQVNVSVRS
ncbi:MAG: ATP-binding cassette domain-containing protein [Bradyrhizobiaceae bacterium]|nr:MAG: ATP-binding cassette domain-containing protein [Bradyrhizobiaceae bacterium]